MTDTAAEAIRGIVAAPGVPEGAGLRIAQADETRPGALEVTVVELPGDSDQVLDEDGARVFVDDRVAPMLDDKVLDAEIEGTRVGFLISDQPHGGDSGPS